MYLLTDVRGYTGSFTVLETLRFPRLVEFILCVCTRHFPDPDLPDTPVTVTPLGNSDSMCPFIEVTFLKFAMEVVGSSRRYQLRWYGSVPLLGSSLPTSLRFFVLEPLLLLLVY